MRKVKEWKIDVGYADGIANAISEITSSIHDEYRPIYGGFFKLKGLIAITEACGSEDFNFQKFFEQASIIIKEAEDGPARSGD